MNIAVNAQQQAARDEAYALPLEQDRSGQRRIASRTIRSGPISSACAARIRFTTRRTAPMAPTGRSTKWNDIMAVDTNHAVFSSADGIVLATLESIIENEKIRGPRDKNAGGFISMDPPDHGPKRKTVTPAVAPDNLARMAPQVRERAGHHPGPAADRRGVRLGRQGVQGTDGDDAGRRCSIFRSRIAAS